MSQRLTIYPSTVAKISSFFRWNEILQYLRIWAQPSGKSGTKLCDRSQVVMAAHDSTYSNWSWEEDRWNVILKLETDHKWVDPDFNPFNHSSTLIWLQANMYGNMVGETQPWSEEMGCLAMATTPLSGSRTRSQHWSRSLMGSQT